MDAARSEPALSSGAEARIFRTFQVSPIWVGLGVGALVFLVYLASGFTLDAWRAHRAAGTGLWRVPDLRETLVLSALLGCALAAEPVARSNAIRLLEAIRRSLRGNEDDSQAYLREVLALQPAWLRACMLLGSGLGAWVSVATDPQPFALTGPRAHEDIWQLLLNMAVCLFFVRAVYATLFIAGRCARIAREELELDPLDLSLLTEFTRFGLRTATLWVVGGSLVALFFLNWGFSVYTALGVTATLGMASAVVLRPVLAVRERIRAEKHAALQRVNDALRRDRVLALDATGTAAAEAAVRLPGLIAYREFLAGLPEWPFDVSTSLRSAVLLFVAMGSWLGGALVERLLGAALD